MERERERERERGVALFGAADALVVTIEDPLKVGSIKTKNGRFESFTTQSTGRSLRQSIK